MQMFEGPNRMRNLAIAAVLIVVVLLVLMYSIDRSPGPGTTTSVITTIG